MSIISGSIAPVAPVAETASLQPQLVLQPGSVVTAQVLQVLEANMVRIAIAGVAIDALSQVPLQVGSSVQLAVSQTADGVRLAVVTPGSGATGAGVAPLQVVATGSAVTQIAAGAVAISPDGGMSTMTTPLATASSTPNTVQTPVTALGANPNLGLDPVAAAVTAAVQAAAPRQASLAPLFANLPVVVASQTLPPQLQQVAALLLAARPELSKNLTADDLRAAFQSSGLFMEAGLASGAVATSGPDLKAALVVLRQVLTTWLGEAAPTSPQAAPSAAGNAPQSATPAQPATGSLATAANLAALTKPSLALPSAGETTQGQPANAGPTAALPAVLRAIVSGAGLDALGKMQLELPALAARAATLPDSAARAETPPPYRGAAPSAQPVASPSITSDMPDRVAGQQLLTQTDAAIARQTLLQAASLPDHGAAAPVVPGQQPVDTTAPRWNFEIPFATPYGTALAQFEIARDGGGRDEVEAAKPVWRARFTLDVEPSGPVHALVSLAGDKTMVRMWAERPATAAQLRANSEQLSRALRQADLEPGDIVVGDGTPPQPAPARAGHFLDRAT